MRGIPSANEKVGPVLNELNSLLKSYRDAFIKLVENEKTIEDLIIQMSGAVGAILLGATLAFVLGRAISRPVTAMCRAMLDLASGNFDVVLPGFGRRDELGEMAGAVEEFRLQAIARAERDVAAQDVQAREASAARQAEQIRFTENFEAAVGSIVSNVSASAG